METTSPLGAILQRWWIVVILAFAGVAIGGLPAPATVEEQAITYSATHTMLLNDLSTAQMGDSAVSPSQVQLLATTGEVPERVAEELGFTGNPPTLAAQVAVEFSFETGALTFSTVQESAEAAEQITDAFADTTNRYLAERQDIAYQDRVATALDRLTVLETELDELTVQLGANPADPALLAQRDAVARQYSVAFEQNRALSSAPPVLAFTTLERAQAVPIVDRGLSAPTSRSVRGAMGGIVGAILGVAIAFVLGRLDRRIRTREQAEEVLGMRARVAIPKTRDPQRDKLIVTERRHDPLSDSYRTVRNVVGFVQNSLEPVDRARVTMVVSPGPGDGKTSLATNLAAAFVESGMRTIAVNTDFRRPRLGRAVDGDQQIPHPFTIEDLSVLAPKSLLTRTELPGLLMMDLSSINGSAGELVRATASMMPTLADTADSIVVDTSPVGVTAEVLEMVPFADVIVVVVRIGHTPISAARRAVAVLKDVSNAPILLVVNSVKAERTPYYDYQDGRNASVEGNGWRSKLRPGRKPTEELERIG